MFKYYFLVLLVSLLASCATNYATQSSEAIAAATIVKDSDFDTQKRFTGPAMIYKRSRGPFVDFIYPRIRAFEDKKTGAISYQLYTAITYTGDRRGYHSASFQGGEGVILSRVSSKIDNCFGMACQFTEVVIVDLPTKRVRGEVNTFQIRLNARSGHESMITIPQHYLEGFASAMTSG